MTRAQLPGSFRNGGARIDTAPACTGGGCNQGRAPGSCDCELSNVVPLRPRSVVLIRPAITVHRVSRARRARRWLRALLRFLTARKADL